MFWESVWGGLSAFAYWQTWVAVVEYMAIFIVPSVLINMRVADQAGGGNAGCLTMLVSPLLQCLATIVFLWTLAPILLRHHDSASWAFPWVFMVEHPFYIVKTVIALILAVLALSFVPILGSIQSLFTLVLGVVSLVFLVHAAAPVEFAAHASRPDVVAVIPSFWFIVGLLIVGGVLAWLGLAATGFLAEVLDRNGTGWGLLLAMPVGALFGFVPVFIYAHWLGLQIQPLITSS